MVYNFESWRKAKMYSVSIGCESMHYYRIDDEALASVISLFQNILRLKFEPNFNGFVRILVTPNLAQNMFAFCEQCKFGYIHPRRDSAKFAFVREAGQSAHTANPQTQKNLSF